MIEKDHVRMKISFHTLGCKLNFAETSAIANRFREADHLVVDRHDHADVLVINTCAVTDVAEKKCRSAIRQAKRGNPDALVVVIGCFSQLRPEEIAAMDEVDIVVGNEHKYDLVNILNQYTPGSGALVDNTNILKTRAFQPGYSLIDRTRTFLKIQDGCNYRCTYCTIPDARGRSRSGRVSEIVDLVNSLDASGVQEIVLTGVNIGDFGRPHGENLLQLLQGIAKLSPASRIRIGSVEPELLSNEIISLIAETPCLMPHFHIPLQAGSDVILKAMKRKYDTSLFADRVHTIREMVPDACIACDVITGFPAESEADFLAGKAFIESLPVSYLHVFTYSERKNTPAQEITPKIPQAIRKDRSKILQEISDKKKGDFYHSNLGTIRKVLFESDNHHGFIEGFTDNYLRVRYPYADTLVNTVQSVKIIETEDDGIIRAEML
jgi:threonylcarbamoyladenosine tRNA methylthiotransferase MtaB